MPPQRAYTGARGGTLDDVEQIQGVYDALRQVAALPDGLFGEYMGCKTDAGVLIEALSPPLTEVAAALTAVDAAKSALGKYKKDVKGQLHKLGLKIGGCKHKHARERAVKEKEDFEKTATAALAKLDAALRTARLAAGEKIKGLGKTMEAVTSATAAEREKRGLPELRHLDSRLQAAAERLRATVSETYMRHLLESPAMNRG